MKKVVIFGAGEQGKRAFERYHELVEYFIDNDVEKQGTYLNGKRVLSLEEFIPIKDDYELIIATGKTMFVEMQLYENGIYHYGHFLPPFFSPDELVVDGYKKEIKKENDWNDDIKSKMVADHIEEYIAIVKNHPPLFRLVEIETVNRCNGVCSFCPVNKFKDPRIECKMDELLFRKIINELEEIEYTGRVCLYSNNEPLLDDRIVTFSKYLREHLPYAQVHMFTNGTLLDIDMFLQLIPYLDELIIDNYNPELKLNKTSQHIKNYIEKHKELINKVTILMRSPNEIITSRGGDAPNRENIVKVERPCVLPYEQMVIRPDGKVSLCCNDALGKVTLGNLNNESMLDVWYGEKYSNVRSVLSENRQNYERCKNCDSILAF